MHGEISMSGDELRQRVERLNEELDRLLVMIKNKELPVFVLEEMRREANKIFDFNLLPEKPRGDVQ